MSVIIGMIENHAICSTQTSVTHQGNDENFTKR